MGIESKSSGNISMFKNENNSVFYTYCPQTNNLDPNMTPKQILRFLCKIYGYGEDTSKIVFYFCYLDCQEINPCCWVERF